MPRRDSEDKKLMEDLTRALGSGDPKAADAAFEAIYRVYARSVAFVCARYLANDADVQSVTDDVFVSFFQRVAYLDAIDSLRAYLTASARHAALDHLRAQNRRERSLVELSAAEDADNPLTLIPDPDGDVTASLRYQGLVDDLCATVGRDAAEIILSHAVCGESFPAIAARLGKKENTVKTVYHRAIKKFRQEKGDRWL